MKKLFLVTLLVLAASINAQRMTTVKIDVEGETLSATIPWNLDKCVLSGKQYSAQVSLDRKDDVDSFLVAVKVVLKKNGQVVEDFGLPVRTGRKGSVNFTGEKTGLPITMFLAAQEARPA